MDAFSADGELTNLHTAFHTGQYDAVLASDTSSLSPSNALPARVLQLRSHIAQCDYDNVISELEGEDDTPDLAAVKLFAQYEKDVRETGDDQGGLGKGGGQTMDSFDELTQSHGDNATVQILGGCVLAREEREAEALVLLGKHQGSLDAVSLIVQIHLAMNRLDLAQQEVRKARGWAQDHLLVNLAESWVGLREGGPKYQPAFYVYEELATTPASLPSASNTQTLLSQAICELHLGRLPEAEAAMATALQQAPEDPDVLANAIVLNTVAGKRKEAADLRQKLEKLDPSHALVKDLKTKESAFESAKGKYSPVFEVKG